MCMWLRSIFGVCKHFVYLQPLYYLTPALLVYLVGVKSGTWTVCLNHSVALCWCRFESTVPLMPDSDLPNNMMWFFFFSSHPIRLLFSTCMIFAILHGSCISTSCFHSYYHWSLFTVHTILYKHLDCCMKIPREQPWLEQACLVPNIMPQSLRQLISLNLILTKARNAGLPHLYHISHLGNKELRIYSTCYLKVGSEPNLLVIQFKSTT